MGMGHREPFWVLRTKITWRIFTVSKTPVSRLESALYCVTKGIQTRYLFTSDGRTMMKLELAIDQIPCKGLESSFH